MQLNTIEKPYMVKILGVPGVGKTAFGSIFQEISNFDNKIVGSVSTDDFYLPYEQRIKLKEQDPRYITRGPPGTIDNELLYKVINGVKNREQNVKLPYFDKSAQNGFGDRTKYIQFEKPIDIFILEGWFTGAKFQENDDILRQQLIEIGLKDEQKLDFALQQNQMLKDYQKLWDLFDCQLILSPTDFKYMFYYRQEAENKLIKQKGSGLTEKQIHELMSFFYDSLCPEIYVKQLLESKETDLIAMFDKQRNLLEVINHSQNL